MSGAEAVRHTNKPVFVASLRVSGQNCNGGPWAAIDGVSGGEMPIHDLDDATPVLPAPGRYWIAPGAHLIGRILLGDEASVWFNAVVRGDNEPISIGARTNIQDGAVLHSDAGVPLTVGADCTIGHRVILHGATIGEGTLIGMGATVLNRAVIGAGSLVGANALVTEGKVFAEGSLILGSPARAVRPLDHGERSALLAAAAHYVANWRRFAAGLSITG
jgi:carbonic anhydrase/acetyltransferase-like protein (isoleucine patch superfamily)